MFAIGPGFGCRGSEFVETDEGIVIFEGSPHKEKATDRRIVTDSVVLDVFQDFNQKHPPFLGRSFSGPGISRHF